jgi:hypothetical protein
MQTTFSNRVQQQRFATLAEGSATLAESSATGRFAARLAPETGRGPRPKLAGRVQHHLGFAYKYKLLYSLFSERQHS